MFIAKINLSMIYILNCDFVMIRTNYFLMTLQILIRCDFTTIELLAIEYYQFTILSYPAGTKGARLDDFVTAGKLVANLNHG